MDLYALCEDEAIGHVPDIRAEATWCPARFNRCVIRVFD
jgi:hypothetical protein